MAGEWLKFESNLPEKPEVLAITASMGWDDPDLTVGKLMRLFRWFDQHTTDGNAKAVTPALLDRMLGVPGFSAAVARVGWLIVSDAGLALNNFDKHNGQSAKSRSETAKRVANHRAKKAGETPEVTEEGGYQRLSIPRPIRAAVLARDGNACVYCNRKDGEYGLGETKRDGFMCMDHIIPTSRGGTDDVQNLVTACTPCNQFKSDRTPEECGLAWPEHDGKRLGNAKHVTDALAREEKRREEEIQEPSVLGAEAPPSTPYRVPKCPTDELVALYHRHLPALPAVEVMNDGRKRSLTARWRDVCGDGKFDKAAGLDWFSWFFERVAGSDFLMGRTAGKSGQHWRADFDFLTTPSKFVKVVEGRYHQGASA